MCQREFAPRLAPIMSDHLPIIEQYLPGQSKFIWAMYDAWTDGLNPALPLVPTLAVMKEWLDQGRYGLWSCLQSVRIPLSIVADDVRYRLPITAQQHETFLSAAMAEKNVRLSAAVCDQFGVALVRGCSCGIMLTARDNRDTLIASPIFRRYDNYRSSLDRRGCPVADVDSFEDIPVDNIDITAVERTMLELIDEIVGRLAEVVAYDDDRFMSVRDLDHDRRQAEILAETARLEWGSHLDSGRPSALIIG